MLLGVFPGIVERFFGEGLLVLDMSGNWRMGQTGTNATSRTVIDGTLCDSGRRGGVTEAQPDRFYMRKSARRKGNASGDCGGPPEPTHFPFAGNVGYNPSLLFFTPFP